MLDLLKDPWAFMRERREHWRAPLLMLLVLPGAPRLVRPGPVVAPFIYTLF